MIHLSWIKKLIDKLKLDSEPKEILHTKKPNTESGSKHIQSKVAYHYPKGQFRFPVIPDQEEKPKRERVRKSVKQEEPVLPVKSGIEEELPKRRRTKEKKQETVQPIPKKSFKPTEIPSPVYAFGKRDKGKPVEYELRGFNGDTPSYQFKAEVEIPPTLEIVEEADLTSLRGERSQGEQKSATEYEAYELETSIEKDQLVIDSMEVADHSTDVSSHNDEMIVVNEESTMKQISLNNNEEKTEEESNNKKQIPFNVVMLKQDKLRWEARQLEKQEMDHKQKQSTIQTEPRTGHVETVEHTHKNIIVDKAQDNQIQNLDSVELNDSSYSFPRLNLLTPPVQQTRDEEWLDLQGNRLNQTLINFNVGASVVNVTQGPSVTRFEVQPEPGVKVNKITNLSDDIKLSLAAKDIRIEAPIPGKHTIGIEVPNQQSRPVLLSEIIQSNEFTEESSPLSVALGLDISGKPIVTDLKKMPHGLIAGATGSGKSVCINSILVSILYKAHPSDVKLLLIDPKMVELAPYNHIPHLVSPVITDVKAATAALKWAVDEMERRYELFAHTGVRDINRFNELAIEHKRYAEKLPLIVIIIDELADLMMMSPADVEEAICRIAQKARACGIHLIVATQRPSVDVITGLIKANIPTRVAFSVSSQVDSRTIIDISGAEKLLGKGDMLFLGNGTSKPVRLQGTFVSDQEIDKVVSHVRSQGAPEFLFEQEELLKKSQISEDEDDLFYEACEFVIEQGGASTSSLQRRFKIGYNRAARLIDMMEQNGFISEGRGSKPREVLISSEDLDYMQE